LEWIRIGRSGKRGPRQVIPAGTKWEPHFTINQPAATLWFHPHVIGTTAIQVYYGLTGLLIVEDENSEALNLPNEYGVKDIHFIYMVLNFKYLVETAMHQMPMSKDGKIQSMLAREKLFGVLSNLNIKEYSCIIVIF